MSKKDKNTTFRRPKLDLPFQKGKVDSGEWAYTHRFAICITLVAYILFGIAFISFNIVIERTSLRNQIVLDFTDFDKIQEELERAEELNHLLNEQYYDQAPISNLVSNENELNEDLDDWHRTDAEEIYKLADEVQDKIDANREEFEAGLQAEQEIRDQKPEFEESRISPKSSKSKGNVTASYSLSQPVRSAFELPIPSYMCEGGGEVVVNIVVNRNGEVVSTGINAGLSTSNECIRSAAVQKAKLARFNANMGAPIFQKGSIVYLFVPQ